MLLATTIISAINLNVDWVGDFGKRYDDIMVAMTLADDGIIAAGHKKTNTDLGNVSDPNTSGEYKATIAKYGKEGTFQWGSCLSGETTSKSMYYGVTTSKDKKSVVAVGELITSDDSTQGVKDENGVLLDIPVNEAQALIVKYNSDGTLNKVVHYGGYGTMTNDRFYSVIATNDGGFLAVGQTGSSGLIANAGSADTLNITDDDIQALVVKFDKDLNFQWARLFGGDDSPQERFYSVAQSPKDNKYIAVGYSTSTESISGYEHKGAYDAVVVKFDEDGGNMQAASFGGSSNEVFYNVTATPDGSFVMTGVTTSNDIKDEKGKTLPYLGTVMDNDSYIVKVKSDLSLVWARTYGGNNEDVLISVINDKDGNYLLAGYSYSADTANTGFINKTPEGMVGGFLADCGDAIIVKLNKNTGKRMSVNNFSEKIGSGITDGGDNQAFTQIIYTGSNYALLAYGAEGHRHSENKYRRPSGEPVGQIKLLMMKADSKEPNTGDNSNIYLALGLMFVSVSALVVGRRKFFRS